MLIYYDNHIILTENMLSYGQYSEQIFGPIKKIYDINDFLLICCVNCVHIYCKKNRHCDVTTCFKHFIINRDGDRVLIIDTTNFNLLMMLNTIVVCRDTHVIVSVTNARILSGNLEDDLDPIPLHVVSKGSFQGFMDLLIYCSY